MSNILQFQQDIADFLAGHADLFQYVHVIREYADEDPGAVLFDDVVNKHLAGKIPKNGKCGLAVIVGIPETKTAGIGQAGPVEDYETILMVVEDKSTNMAPDIGTGIRCDDMFETVKKLLHLHAHDGVHGLMVVNGDQFRDVPKTQRAFFITIQSKAHGLTPMEPCKRPVITLTDPLMSIATATDGATLHYTLDGTFPSAANAAALTYTQPVDVGELAAGTVIRAAAFKTGMRGSDCARAVL